MNPSTYSKLVRSVTRRRKVMKLCCVAPALWISACATSADPEHAFDQGWRRAKVLQVGHIETVMPGNIAKDCRTEQVPGATFTRYALVSYSWGGSPNLRSKRVVSVPDGIQLDAGQTVLVNLRNCQAPLAVDSSAQRL